MGLGASIAKALGGGVASVAGAAFGKFQEGRNLKIKRATRKDELDAAIHTQQLDNVKQGKINEAAWNANSIKKAGWRPGYLTVIFTVPLVLVFFPWFVPHIEAGFTVLDSLPEWYRWTVSVVVASGFGYKAIADSFSKKKYE